MNTKKIRVKAGFLITLIALFSIVFSSVASAEITVSPETMQLYLTGGDVVTEQITITWKGETATVAFIETEITPDGKGINVTYSEDPVVLYPGAPKTIDITIATAINIAPGNYTITTLIFTEVEKWIEYRGGDTTTIYETVEIENLTRINTLLDSIRQLRDELNMTKGNYTEQIALLNGIIDTLDDLVESLEEQLEGEPADEDKWFAPFLALLIIVIVAIVIVMIHKFRVLKSQKDKEVKENEHKDK